ncbi:hypothetical protein FB45DRAFT_1055041 [Roridomyces roridus]|uniref:Uncharacterized protein n=1 Tax=Roridomyces roridus TaxID=1738132 RepID=A0AAD7FV06_9AGAR|nr:hypothetical protein FB45DRAFT_1055041 [Roridomyces roridus]
MLLSLFLLLSTVVLALPTWDGLHSRMDFVDSLVPLATQIVVKGPDEVVKGLCHLSSPTPGETGNLTILPDARSSRPPFFSLNREDSLLWQYTNATTIFPVVVKNTSLVDGVPPFQIVLGKQQSKSTDVVSRGIWSWRGTMLRFRLGDEGPENQGLYYACPTGEGDSIGLFMFLTPSLTNA